MKERTFKAFKNAEGNESVMVTFSANDATYRMWLSIKNAKNRSDKFWLDHSGNEPTPVEVSEFIARAGELTRTLEIQVRPKGRYFEIVGIKNRRRPVPIPGRISNAELQAEIDATLDIRILGDTKLRDILGNTAVQKKL